MRVSLHRLPRWPALALLLTLAACDTEIVLTRDRRPGMLGLDFVDAGGACVKGVQMEFSIPGGSPMRAVNAYDCFFGTSGPPGEWTVTLTPPAGYGFGPGQQNPLVVRVRKGETLRQRIVLVAQGR